VGDERRRPDVKNDQRGRTVHGDQRNVAGDVHHAGPPPPDPAILVEQGVVQLRAGAYQRAAEKLRQALDTDPACRRAAYHLALALLRGRRPKTLAAAEVREIDELLGAAIASAGGDGLFHWFRALLRDDYYNGNGLTCPAPTVGELVAAAAARNVDRDELRALLHDVPMPGNGLHSELVRALN
jgi:hypothetical protein